MEVDGSDTTVRKTYSAGSTSLAVRTIVNDTTETLNWLLSDHLGSSSITTTADGTWNSELRYSAFGETRYSSGITPTDYRYTGQLEQADVNLYYYNARYYDAALGRFVQADTIIPGAGNSKSYDRYSYVNNNPVIFTDPSGHHIFEDDPQDEPNTYFINPYVSYLYYGTHTAQRVTKYSSVMYSELSEKEPDNYEEKVPAKPVEGNAEYSWQYILPSHIGFRMQVEGCGKTAVGPTVTYGMNFVYNFYSGQATINHDITPTAGPGVGYGGSVTMGLLIGFHSTNINDIVSGSSHVFLSGTTAAGPAASISLSSPANKDLTLHVDPYFNKVPFTLYLGGGGGAGYASIGAGESIATDNVQEVTDEVHDLYDYHFIENSNWVYYLN